MKFITKDKIYNITIYGFGQAINLISPLLVIPHIVYYCGEEGLGKTGVGFSFALIAIVLVDYGSYINGTKEISINNNDRKILEEKFTSIYLSKLLLLIAVLLICCIIILVVPFFQKDKIVSKDNMVDITVLDQFYPFDDNKNDETPFDVLKMLKRIILYL